MAARKGSTSEKLFAYFSYNKFDETGGFSTAEEALQAALDDGSFSDGDKVVIVQRIGVYEMAQRFEKVT
jgi:hypothetical protein